MIPKETIAQIFETARVEEVVGDFVHLKKKGTNLWGLCPFHNEKSPSFSVSPAKGIYKCFGCGEGGNAVNFIMSHEKLTYPEALRYVAKKYNIEIKEQERTPEQEAEQNGRESLLHVLAFAQRNFTENLLESEEGKTIGLSYFKERGFSMETIEKFQLGYAFDRYDAFHTAATEAQYQKKYLIESGLCIDREGKLLDRFKGRVMFPIHNLSGKVIAFGGRTLRTDKKIAKYINSPETEVYHKGSVLYGIFQAKKDIIGNDECYMVEGYTDVISLHQAGVCNVVASSGTSLTVEQIRLIRRYTPNLTIMYDGDAAGIKASFRGIDLVLEEGMNVRTVLFPDGEDPDSYARHRGGEDLKDFVKANATDFIEFKTRLLVEETKGDPIRTAALIKEIIASIALIPDPIMRNLYVRKCGAIMLMEEEVLMMELNRQRRRNFDDRKRTKDIGEGRETVDEAVQEQPTVATRPQIDLQPRDSEGQERDIVRILMVFGQMNIEFDVWDDEGFKVIGQEEVNVADYLHGEIAADGLTFDNPLYQRIFDEVGRLLELQELPTEHHFSQHQDPEVAQLAVNFLSNPYTLSNQYGKHNIEVRTEEMMLKRSVVSSLNSLKLRKLEKMTIDLQEQLKSASEDDALIIMARIQKFQKVRRQLADHIGTIVLK
ncbi:MAG: DNA primase [Flavobacteriales bacterium]|nr:DNA primase [Flavobacteriales bacterium]